jgi:hypothetical protein
MKSVRGLGVIAVGLWAAGVVGCVTVRDVRGPDGDPAHLISCVRSPDCYAKAEEVCGGDYQIKSTVGQATGRTEVLVTCGAASEPEVADAPSPVTPTSTDATRDDSAVCTAASKGAADFAHYWAAHSPNAKPLPDLPEPSDFVSVCHELPAVVQRCMHAKYRAVHGKACDAVLLRLDAAERNKIDGLFLEAPDPAVKAGGA